MIVLYWNVHDFRNSDTKIAWSFFICLISLWLFFWLNLWLILCKFPHGIGVTKSCTNERGNMLSNLWTVWENDVKAIVIFVSDQCIDALLVFKNLSLVRVLLRNWWHNARSLGIQVISSHIFYEGNCCVDRLASMGHSVDVVVWLSILPTVLQPDFYLDRCGMPRFRFT